MKYCFGGKGIEEPSLQALHIVFVHSLGREEKEMQRILCQCVYSEAKLTIVLTFVQCF